VLRRADAERGSALALMPAAVIIFVILAAITVDFALLFLAQRELGDAAAAAANDAVVVGLEEAAFYECGALELDEDAVDEAVRAAVDARVSDAVEVTDVAITPATSADGEPEVAVALTGRVDLIFAPAVPGYDGTAPVRASSEAVARQDVTIAPLEERC
jgi:hypothetical protein